MPALRMALPKLPNISLVTLQSPVMLTMIPRKQRRTGLARVVGKLIHTIFNTTLPDAGTIGVSMVRKSKTVASPWPMHDVDPTAVHTRPASRTSRPSLSTSRTILSSKRIFTALLTTRMSSHKLAASTPSLQKEALMRMTRSRVVKRYCTFRSSRCYLSSEGTRQA